MRRAKSQLELALEHVSVVAKVCRIWGGFVSAHNGVLSAAHPVPEVLECYAEVMPLRKALARAKGVASLTVKSPAELVVASEAGSEIVPLRPDTNLPAIYPDPASYDIGAARQLEHRLIYGIECPPDTPIAFHNAQRKIKQSVTAGGYSGNTFTIHFENGAWLKTSLIGPEFVIEKPAKAKEPVIPDTFEVTYSKPIRTIGSGDWRGATLICDVECYPNFFLADFKNTETCEYYRWTPEQPVALLADLLTENTIVTFNGKTYDVPMIVSAIRNPNPRHLFGVSKKLIGGELWFRIVPDIPELDHVDLLPVAPLSASLKLYGARLGSNRIQDLPYDPEKKLTPEQIVEVIDYCDNDLDNTELLMEDLIPQLTLRTEMGERYGTDLMSKSDAQIAEKVITSELYKLNGLKIAPFQPPQDYKFHYKPPAYLCFRDPALNRRVDEIAAYQFTLTEAGGPDPGELFKQTVWLSGHEYRMGIGGLHSCEESISYQGSLTDRDVASYYPAIIVNQRLYPETLGPGFLDIYKSIMDERLAAKKAKDKVRADSLKITVNGTFGKLGSRFSKMYSPALLTQVTITGQLSLLLLIEMLTDSGCEVLSANTDGVVYRGDGAAAAKQWEELTGFTTEETSYRSIHIRDVNNYIAVKDDGSVKTKGCFTQSSLSRNPEYEVCNEAVIAHILNGSPMALTIRSCRDTRKFCAVRTVQGGAVKSGVYLGKTVRWYWSKKMKDAIYYRESGNRVPNSDGARPLMEMPDVLPDDVDYDRYIARAEEMLVEVGYGRLL